MNEVTNEQLAPTEQQASVQAEMQKEAAADISAERKKASRVFSRSALSIILPYILVTVISGVLFAVIASIPGANKSTAVVALIGTVPIFIIGYPLTFLIMRKTPKRVAEKGKFSIKTIAVYFPMSLTCMFLGNIIGTVLSAVLSAGTAKNQISSILSAQDIIASLLLIIAAPIFEELVFRKLFIDRLSPYGEKWAVIFTALCFAMFHMNLFQFFSTLGLGLVLGFVYVKTNNIINTIIIHIIVNFFGGFLAPMALSAIDTEKLQEFSDQASAGSEPSAEMLQEVLPGLIIFFGFFMLYGMIILAGIILFFVCLKKFRFERSEILPGSKEGFRAMFLNPGMIVNIILSLIFTVLALFSPLITELAGK